MPFKEPVLDYMKKHGISETRQNYLTLNYFGQVPDPLPAEDEADLPAKIRFEKRDVNVAEPPKSNRTEPRISSTDPPSTLHATTGVAKEKDYTRPAYTRVSKT